VAGFSNSYDGDITTFYEGDDFWIQKLNDTGTTVWQKSFGGSQTDQAKSVRQTSDGGYIIAGLTNSTDGQVIGNHGNYDYWVIKTNDTGGIEWKKCYGGTGNDQASAIQQTTDGGYIVAGFSRSNDGQVTGHHGMTSLSDIWVVKLNDTGAIEWQTSLGGTDADVAASVIEAMDGSFTIAGFTLSHDGDITTYRGQNDFWLLNLSTAGVIRWQKTYGGSNADNAYSLIQTPDSGYIIAGSTRSSDGDITGYRGLGDVWIVKTDDTGALQWQQSLGGTGLDQAHSICRTLDSGYILTGITNSLDGDVSGLHGTSTMQDYWVVKLSDTGALQWQKCLGGTNAEYGYDIVQTSDTGYVIAGMASSLDGDVTGMHTTNDFWVVKLKDTLSISLNANTTKSPVTDIITIVPNPVSDFFRVTGTSNMPAKISVYNTLGQLMTDSLNDAFCSVSALQPGIYFVRVIGQQGEIIKQGKIIKQ
jgi:hypothetical protein